MAVCNSQQVKNQFSSVQSQWCEWTQGEPSVLCICDMEHHTFSVQTLHPHSSCDMHTE